MRASSQRKSFSAASYIAVAFWAGALGVSSGVRAQAQEPAAKDQQQVEEITVTGSRIVRTSGFSTPVPVTAVTAEELHTLKPGTTLTDQLGLLPQFYNTQSAQRGGGALFGTAGGSYLDLRSLGPQRTLILLDGARVAPADRNGSVNVDSFPTALLRSVEVVTGGASAAYGADALAGVTNFIINRDFRGLNVSAEAGATSFGDGNNMGVSIVGGTELAKRWSFVGSFEHQNINQIRRDPDEAGDWFRREGFVQNPAWSAANPAGAPRQLVLPDVHSTLHTPTGKIRGVPNTSALNGLVFSLDGKSLRPFNTTGAIVGCGAPGCAVTNPAGGTGSESGGPEAAIANDAFEGGPYGAEVDRNNLFAGFTFDANPKLRFFTNVMASKIESNNLDSRGIPHGTAPWNYTIYKENAFLPQSIRDTMTAEGLSSFTLEKQGTILDMPGNYDDHEERRNSFESWTLQFGVDKQIGDKWRMQTRVQRGATRKYTAVLNELRVDKEYLGMDAVEVYPDRRDLNGDGIPDLVADADRGKGTILCNVNRYNPTTAALAASVATVLVPSVQGDDSLGSPTERVHIPGPVGPDAINGCVPYNVLGQGNVSQAAQQYVVSPKWGDSVVSQDFAEVLFTGDIWKGFGPGSFALATGVTYRSQKFWQRGQPQALMAYGPPTNAVNLGIRGFPSGFSGGSANLHEFSTVPAIKGAYDVNEMFGELSMPLWDKGPRRLEVDVAARRSDYSTSGNVDSWKGGINFQIAPFLRFRTTKSRDVREPTFSERYDLQGGGGNVMDPLKGNATVEITIATGGNPDLRPELADTVTAGFVFQPKKIKGLQLSVDWYDINLKDAVGQLGVSAMASAQTIVNSCAAGVTSLCSLVSRDPVTGDIGTVRSVFQNIDNARTRGIDYELLFTTEPNFAKNRKELLTFRFLAGALLEDSVTSNATGGGRVTTDNSNLYSEPDFEALASVRYQIGPLGFNLQTRYIPETVLNNLFVQWRPGLVLPTLNPPVTVDDNSVESQTSTDLTFSYDASEKNANAHWRAALAISNLFNVDPPVVADFGQRFSSQSPTIPPNNFDVYGRRYLFSFDYRF